MKIEELCHDLPETRKTAQAISFCLLGPLQPKRVMESLLLISPEIEVCWIIAQRGIVSHSTRVIDLYERQFGPLMLLFLFFCVEYATAHC